jgi:hypothetical protein
MLEITRKTLSLKPEEVIDLERIVLDGNREGAFAFVKNIYRKLVASQEGRLKSPLGGCFGPQGSGVVKD